jgi:hypothetical protein
MLFMLLASAEVQPRILPLPLQAAVKRAADAELKDAPCARWKWPEQKANRDIYCGWVNSRNSFAAYSGWQPYSVAFDNGRAIVFRIIAGNGVLQQAMRETCSKEENDLDSVPTH